MKRSRFLLLSMLLMSACLNKVKAQINPNSTEDKIIVNVSIGLGFDGVPSHIVHAVQLPNNLTANNPLPLEIHYENNTLTDYYLHIDHKGPITDIAENNLQSNGGVQPVRIPPNGTGNGSSQIIYDQLPQEPIAYLFGSGEHSLTFRLLNTDNPSDLGYIARDEISFSITLLSITYSRYLANNLLVYPNPFISDISFDFSNTISQLESTVITITIYDQNGRIKDRMEKNIAGNPKIVYQNESLPKGRYYYTITSKKDQKIDAGILLKE